MAEIESVGLSMETSGIDKGIKALNELSKQGPKVEASMAGISGESKRAAKSLADLGMGAGDGLKKTGEAAKQAATGIKASGTAAREAVTDTASLGRAVAGLTAQEDKFIRSLMDQANALRMSRGDFAAYTAAQRGMGEGAQEVSRAIGNKIAALKAEQDSLTGTSNSMLGAAKGYAAIAAAAALAYPVVMKLVSVQREFDKLSSSLITVTGSAANAASQMAWLKDFAKETPFGLAQATEAFVKMKSLGLDPTRAALTSFGNTASAMGKDLNQMIEAVADATTGEFERLKEFGIKASKDGEEIKLTFQGVTTTIRNSANEINEYLRQIGENEFAGAMAERAKTIDGAISELGDTWDDLFRTINANNTGQFIYDSVKLATGAIEDLTTIISGANSVMDDGVRAGNGFKAVQEGIATVFETVTALGLNVKYVLTQVGNEIGGLVAQGAALARGDFAGAAAIREAMVSDAKAARSAVDQQTQNVLQARKNAQEIANYRKQIADSALGSLAGQVDGYKPIDADSKNLQGRVESILNATKGYKSQAEAMAEVRKQGASMNAMLKELRDSGQGSSQAAKDLETRLAGVNEKLADMGKKGRDRSGEAAVKKEVSAYQGLMTTINEVIAKNQAQIDGIDKLTESQRLEIKLNEELKSGKLKLSSVREADARAAIAIARAQEKSIETTKMEAAVTEQLRQIRASLVGDLEKSAQAYLDSNKSLEDEIALIGKSNSEHTKIQQSRNQEIILIKKATLAEQQRQDAISGTQSRVAIALEEEITQLERRNELLGLKNVTEQADANAKLLKEQFDQTVQQVEDIFVSGFADMLNNGKSGWESFCKSLKTSFMTLVAKQIYTAFVKPIVITLVGNLMGMTGGGGWLSALGGLVGMGGGGSGGGSNIMGLASNANTAYNIYSGNGMAGQAYNTVAGWFGYGSAAPWSTVGVQASGAVTAPVTGGVGAAAPGSGGWAAGAGEWIAGGGWALAIPVIAAYLGGMFKEERMVGMGLTGDLGGDMYGYQLMRESGGIFDGPDYRYVVAEKEIADTKARIEELRRNIKENPQDERRFEWDRQIQLSLNKLDVLERNYTAAIEGSKGPIKVLQDAYGQMRENTASRADSLGLNGDAIRAMKVALGLDEIHPDTGGTGLQLTGLSQEEATTRIQQALEQANEELARSVLGSWQEQTREVTRTVWDDVMVSDGGDTERYNRVGREVTEMITENVFVMSEYVRQGETAIQALTRLSDSLVGVNQVFDLLGATLLQGSLSAADWASSLIDAMGSMDALAQAASNYFDLFYTDAEKQAYLAAQANKGMESRGLSLRVEDGDAKARYKQLVDQAIADQDEALLAWLLKFAQAFSNGVDAVAASAEAAKQAAQAAADALKAAQDAALRNLQAAIGREKEYWNQFAEDAKSALTKASGYFDLVTGAAASLRGSVADVSTMQAAAGMVFIEQAVENARKGMGLSDFDQTKTAISAATSGLVMDNYASQAGLDYDKKVLAGQLSELGDYAELAKSDAQKQIDLANAQIKTLDETLKFWQEYGKEQIDATLSVADAIKALEALMFPEKEASQGSSLTQSAKQASIGSGGGGQSGSGIVGYTKDGRAVYSDGSTQSSAGSNVSDVADRLAAGKAPTYMGELMGQGGYDWDEERKLYVPKFDVGTNRVPRDMLAMVHKDERIIPAADNRALMAALNGQGSGPGNAEVVAELRALNQRLQAIEAGQADVASNTRKTAAVLSNVTDGGYAMRQKMVTA